MPNHKQMYGRRSPDQNHPALTRPAVTLCVYRLLAACTFSCKDNTQTPSICEGRPLILTKLKSDLQILKDFHNFISYQIFTFDAIFHYNTAKALLGLDHIAKVGPKIWDKAAQVTTRN